MSNAEMPVLELTDDGGFDIPSPEKVSTRIPIQFDDANDDDDDVGEAQLTGLTADSLLDGIEEGSYKVFRSPVDVAVVFRLRPQETPSKCIVSDGRAHLVTSDARKLSAPLPQGVTASGRRTCSYFNEFVVVKVQID